MNGLALFSLSLLLLTLPALFAEGAENNYVDERIAGKGHHLQEAAKTLVMDKAIDIPGDFLGGEGGKKVGVYKSA